MIPRLLKLPKKQSFFLFGARNTGKSTLIKSSFKKDHCLIIDLLDPEAEDRFARNPNELEEMVDALPSKISHIVIDEVQKIPKLLNVIHRLIEKTDKYFIMTGSSARKLKYGGANLLAGRAFVYHLFPFSFYELKTKFEFKDALQYGLLPKIALSSKDEEKQQFLRAYALTYLKEEIWSEQFIKKLDPFRYFLEVSAQCNGKIINYANLARDVGVDEKTISSYFTLLEDTLIGFFLMPFQHSFRKRISQKPKFYFFDLGVVHALSRIVSLPLQPRTSYYGEQFEHFVILEIMKLASYFYPDYRFSYLRTKDDNEIDLIVERPGLSLLMIEIKSSTKIQATDLTQFIKITQDFKNAEAICLSQDTYTKKLQNVTCIHWKKGILKYFFKK